MLSGAISLLNLFWQPLDRFSTAPNAAAISRVCVCRQVWAFDLFVLEQEGRFIETQTFYTLLSVSKKPAF